VAAAMSEAMDNFKTASIGERLKHWRTQKQVSQLDLALDCDTSARHVSFIETGKAHPTRDLLIALAEALTIPVSALNNMLIAAGYAPQYKTTGLDSIEMNLVRGVLENMVLHNGSNPSLLIDPLWNITFSNDAFIRLCHCFIGNAELLEQQPLNLLRLVLHPQGLISACTDPSQLYRALMSRARRDMTVQENNPDSVKLMVEMTDYKPEQLGEDYMIPPQLMVPLTLKKGRDIISLSALTATLGEPLTITLRELQLEFFIPADQASQEFLDKLMQD